MPSYNAMHDRDLACFQPGGHFIPCYVNFNADALKFHLEHQQEIVKLGCLPFAYL